MSTKPIRLAMKRMIDLVLCAILLVAASPLLLLIAIAVKLTSRGPLFFVQHRVGLNARSFRMYKFRTMRADHRGGDAWSNADEMAVTPIGGVLRDYGLDELPQLLNIFNGDMSIIGPRPPLTSQLGRYDERLRETFAMRPGVLSLAAVEGRRAISPEQRMELHLRYVKEWSLRLDFSILWRCALVVLRRQNANETSPAVNR